MQLNLKVFQFFGGSSGQVPDVLTERYQAYTYLLLLFVSAGLFIMETAFVPMVGLIAGDHRLHLLTRDHTLTGFQFTGLVCTGISFFWVLHTFSDHLMIILFATTLLFHILLRLIKEFWCVLQAGVMWYYIILYLCTLEILPLLAAFQYVSDVFSR